MKDWQERIIMPVVKKGKGKKVTNYRGLTLTSSLYKLYASVLVERLREDVEEKGVIPQNQTGFRKGMATMGNIYVINHLINRQISKPGEKFVAFFVDLRAAFDSVDREILIEMIKKRRVRERLIRRCEEIRETRNRIRVGEEIGEVFWIRRGVRQRCPVSLYLFMC